MLGGHPGWVVSQGEILAELLAARGHRVHLTSNLLNPVLRLADMVRTLVTQRRSIDVTVVMVFSGRGFAVADLTSWVARRLGQPLIYCLRGGNLPTFAARHPRWIARVMRRADLLVAPSPYLAAQLPSWGPPVDVIPNIVRLDRYPFRQRDRPREGQGPRLLWMRTFHHIYCPELALEALALLRSRHPDATLTMAGQDAGLLATTRARAERLGLAGVVRFAGFLDTAAKQREFDRHDIFLNTNKVDNMPVSVVEAAAFGLPVVATAVGGIPYLLRDGETALLVPSGDAQAMSTAVERLIDEPGLAGRLSRAGRHLAEASDWPAVAAAWDAAFARTQQHRTAQRRPETGTGTTAP
jgi:glycosyltransferase involved in cell wall biosynthesis